MIELIEVPEPPGRPADEYVVQDEGGYPHVAYRETLAEAVSVWLDRGRRRSLLMAYRYSPGSDTAEKCDWTGNEWTQWETAK